MNASEAKDALEDCKRRLDWFKNFDPKSHRHISHVKKRIAALETRLRALNARRCKTIRLDSNQARIAQQGRSQPIRAIP